MLFYVKAGDGGRGGELKKASWRVSDTSRVNGGNYEGGGGDCESAGRWS